MKKLFFRVAGFMAMCSFLFVFVMTTMFVVHAIAQVSAPPENLDQAQGLLQPFLAAVAKGDWNAAGGCLLMVLMIFARQESLKWGLSSDVLPIVGAVFGAVAVAGLGMSQGVEAGLALKNGLVMSLVSGGAWSLFGKFLAKKILGDKYIHTDANGFALPPKVA